MGPPLSSSSSSSTQNNTSQITPLKLFSFHNIDRQLFSRLVFHMRREPSEAMQIAAFWLWLERYNTNAHFVQTILTFPDPLFETVLEETLLCLRAAEAEFESGPHPDSNLPMIQAITGMHGITPLFFHENRVLVLLGVGSIVQKVCLRAFQDLVQMIVSDRAGPLYNYYYNPSQPPKDPESPSGPTGGPAVGGGGGGSGVGGLGLVPPNQGPLSFHSQDLGHGVLVYYPSYNPPMGVNPPPPPPPPPPHGISPPMFGGYGDPGASSSNHPPNPDPRCSLQNPNDDPRAYHPRSHIRPLDQEVVELFNQIHLETTQHQPLREEFQDGVVPSTERTIFLTFSKGYPVSEIELRDFLTRTFGNIIEALYMQEVGDNEQPLYARLVVPDLNTMMAVLSGQGKAKFSINGKHVWARKYVHKNNHNSPPPSPN